MPAAGNDPYVTLRKVLEHEERLGCQDTAVLGGIEAFVARGLSMADDVPATPRAALAELLAGYGTLATAERQARVAAALRRLAAAGAPGNPPSPASAARPEPPPHQRATSGPTMPRDSSRGTLSPSYMEASPATSSSSPRDLSRGTVSSSPHASSRAAVRASAAAQSPAAASSSAPTQPPAGSTPSPSGRTRAAATRVALANDRPAATPAPIKPAATGTGLDGPVTRLRGVSGGYARLLQRLGIGTIRDLLYHFPRRHIDYRQTNLIKDLTIGETASVLATIWEVHARRARSGLPVIEMVAGDESGTVGAVWFNQPHLVKSLPPNRQIALSGRVEVGPVGQPYFKSPDWELIGDDELLHAGRLVPVHPLTEGLSGRWLRRLIKSALDRWIEELRDYQPAWLRREEGLLELPTAVGQMHFPESDVMKDRAERRLAFDELFLIQLGVLQRRREWAETTVGHAFDVDPALVDSFLASLPYRLTAGQQSALADILGDMARPQPMTRLLQGDVGSGKTVVAAAAMLVAANAGFQSVLMAPTEILAEQHNRTLTGVFANFGPCSRRAADGAGLTVRLLTGSMSKREREQIYGQAKAGEVDVLVGTHAVIQEGVALARLGLAVVDEQHRFGVLQRAALREKGYNPDLLVMTATPIPRTLALTLYGDLDISTIRELPPGRPEIRTLVLGPQQRASAYEAVRHRVAADEQVFIICPLVAESEKIEAKAAVAEHERLQREVFPDLHLGLVHGRMAAREKEATMRAFRSGELQVLVSTAVVEVGIDVPNATVMLVEGADRFGLAQLHQFRGRVGRGTANSYCILLSDSPSAEAEERLQVLARTRDGSLLAEEDLRLRGPGEFFGTRQHGLPDLKVARLSDNALLEVARAAARRLLDRDPRLAAPEHRLLQEKVALFWRGDGGAS